MAKNQGTIPGALDCTNCTNITVVGCVFTAVGGAAINFGEAAQHNTVEGCQISDASASAVSIGGVYNPETTVPALMSTGNTLTNTVIIDIGKEIHGCTGVWAGYNKGLRISHNNLTRLPVLCAVVCPFSALLLYLCTLSLLLSCLSCPLPTAHCSCSCLLPLHMKFMLTTFLSSYPPVATVWRSVGRMGMGERNHPRSIHLPHFGHHFVCDCSE